MLVFEIQSHGSGTETISLFFEFPHSPARERVEPCLLLPDMKIPNE